MNQSPPSSSSSSYIGSEMMEDDRVDLLTEEFNRMLVTSKVICTYLFLI